MSEYQYVAFRAIDGPVSPENMKFMEKQSSRADIKPHSFENEYHYGDFRGNAKEMLQRGYDIHFHYANFGVRKVMIRFADGLPNLKAVDAYLNGEGIGLLEDKNGPGLILEISPSSDGGSFAQDLYPRDKIDELVPLRDEILAGDLRPWYLAHLAASADDYIDPDEFIEGPVPAGLGQLTSAQHALARVYGLDEYLLRAAAVNSEPLPDNSTSDSNYLAWVQQQPPEIKDAWLAKLMNDASSNVRRELLGQYHVQQNLPAWPTTPGTRSLRELRAAAEVLSNEAEQRRVAVAAKKRKEELAKIAANPKSFLNESAKLAEKRDYSGVASLLVDIREALADTPLANLAAEQAKQLKNDFPKLRLLTSALRKVGFVLKEVKPKIKANK
ncbi:hypothetical protein NA78x_004798 [Anatilimnocola sp. NA78]|uniref:hypothetical protein n=1 Tax=Anatilimnocola sp. NA78 TaxID=3415683 RepID=UPI003CE51414